MSTLIIIFIIALAVLIISVVAGYIKDRRDVRRKTVESIGNDLWREMDRERQESIEKGKMFRKTLEDVKKQRR